MMRKSNDVPVVLLNGLVARKVKRCTCNAGGILHNDYHSINNDVHVMPVVLLNGLVDVRVMPVVFFTVS